LFKDPLELPILLSQNVPLYQLPPIPTGKFFMTGQYLNRDQMAQEINELPLEVELEDSFFFPEQQEKHVSVMPFRHGHLLQLLAANVINNVELRKDDQHLIVSGRTRYVVQRKEDKDAATEWWERDIEISKPVMDLCTLDLRAGKFEIYTNQNADDGARLSAMFDYWVRELAQAVIDQFTFLYDFDFSQAMTIEQQRALSQVGLARVLPGREQGGLLAGQLHSVAAAYRSLLENGHVFFNAMMSFGKTACYTALMVLADQHYRKKMGERFKSSPVLFSFVTEPHLVEKMKREVEDFWTTYNDENGDGRKLQHVPIVRVCETPADIAALVRSAYRQWMRPHVAVMSRMRIKLTAGWKPVWNEERCLLVRTGGRLEPFYLKRHGSFAAKTVTWEKVPIPDYHERKFSKLVLERQAVLVETVIGDDGCERMTPGSERIVTVGQEVTKEEWTGSGQRASSLFAELERSDLHGAVLGRCSTCGALIREEATEAGALPAILVGESVLTDFLGKLQRYCAAEIKTGAGSRVCGAALWQEARLVKNKVGNVEYYPTYGDFIAKHDPSILVERFLPTKPPPTRYPLADFISRASVTVEGRPIRLRNIFRVTAFDEVHNYKGGDTSQGYAMGTLARASDLSVLMTGTLTNGRADSVFYLMYRMISVIRQMFDYQDWRKFARRFGVIETKLKKPTAALMATGRFSGKPSWRKVGEKVKPGMSPELIRFILARGFFVTLEDLGFQMQPRHDAHESVELEPYQQVLFDQFYLDCRDALREAKKAEVNLAGAYVHRILGYPNAMFRPHVLADKWGKEWARAPGIEWVCKHGCSKQPYGGQGWHCLECHSGDGDERRKATCPDGCYEHRGLVLLPKEKWLVEKVRRNMEDGRKTLVYCRQTDILDIIDRLMKIERSVGASAARLPKGNSRKREGWLRKMSPSLDVLFCNPRSVETGLDLVDYSEAIFYEPEYRIYTCDQAAARVHRLTSPGPVDITWSVYLNTEEAAAIDSIVSGLTVAAMFSGETYALADFDDTDFIQGMVSRLTGVDLKVVDLASRFADFRDKSTMMASLIEGQGVQFDIDTQYNLEGEQMGDMVIAGDYWEDIDPALELKQLSLF
jgi:hypothetical protein